MSGAARRHFLREGEAKEVLDSFSRRIKVDAEELLGVGPAVEIAEVQAAQIFLIDGRPLFAKSGDHLFPTLVFDDLFPLLPRLVVDMGAVPHVCNGADVMAPGVVRVEGKFDEGNIVLVVDERHGKPLAIAVALLDSRITERKQHGKVARTIHYVGDKLWSALSNF